ncbi:four helix bundle protein [Reichenbachiella agarivorans]|uniref:Four helix bundle protein n=1 Tax=Reichenbachiella agarivorans TaxID=2979464 RepID=A0ABY6CRJ2_9BACT|nr:four helix bundle protein [Reichenbachiella agarivorans]UXP33131.1 four helix bundle protein [Reichenbachiella agarivorans]
MHNYKELNVWKKSVDLAVKVYQETSSFPSDEKYGMTSQIRRCSVSISSNIAEGSGRSTDKDFNLFLGYSYGSSCELETQLIVSNRVGLLGDDKFKGLNNDIQEIQKMLFSLRNSLK